MKIKIVIFIEKGFYHLIVNQRHLMVKKISLHPLLFSQRNSKHFKFLGWFFTAGDL